MHTVAKGDLAVAMLTAAFLQRQYTVLKPLSELCRYDLVVDRGRGFERVQCKTGRLRGGAVHFKTCSSLAHHRKGAARTSYRGQIELFGVYCPDNEGLYLVPVDDVGQSEAVIRCEPARNGQAVGVRSATDYQL